MANCTFWGEGNNCQAEAILVEIDGHANRDYEMESSVEPYHSAEHEDQATKVAQTCCHTFRPKSN